MLDKKLSKILGFAFVFQFATSFSSGVFISSALIVEDDIIATMMNIASNPMLMKTNILVDMLTALGVTFLGAILYLALRKVNEKFALTAFAFYILEAALLAVSRTETYTLLKASQEYVNTNQSEYLETIANIALESMDFVGGTLHALAFCVGGLIFYWLLLRSNLVPRWLSIWGLVTIIPVVIGTITAVFNYQIPFALFVPYVPFELVLGIWLVIKGFNPSAISSNS